MQIILSSHGKYALETKKSIEMIVGERNDIHTVTFEMNMSLDDLIGKYLDIIKKISNEKILILVDIVGGSPANAALLTVSKTNMPIKIYSGFSLNMVLSLLFESDIKVGIEESINSIKELSINEEE